MKLLTTKDAAERLGLSVIRVRELIRDGKIQAQRVGRDWVVEESALEFVKVYGKAGRPPKAEGFGGEGQSPAKKKAGVSSRANKGKVR